MLRYPALPPQASLDSCHPPAVPFVVVPEQMQQPVERQPAELETDPVTGRMGLSCRDALGDHDVTQEPGTTPRTRRIDVGRERQYIGGPVPAQKPPVERSHLRVAHERDGNITPRRRRRHPHQPAIETVGRDAAPARIGHDDAQRGSGGHGHRRTRSAADPRQLRPYE